MVSGLRVVEPPTYPAECELNCTWDVYKDPADVPEHCHTDVGRQKPASIRRRPERAG